MPIILRKTHCFNLKVHGHACSTHGRNSWLHVELSFFCYIDIPFAIVDELLVLCELLIRVVIGSFSLGSPIIVFNEKVPQLCLIRAFHAICYQVPSSPHQPIEVVCPLHHCLLIPDIFWNEVLIFGSKHDVVIVGWSFASVTHMGFKSKIKLKR